VDARLAERPPRVATRVDLALHVRPDTRDHVKALVARDPHEPLDVPEAVVAEAPGLDLVVVPEDVDADRVEAGGLHRSQRPAPLGHAAGHAVRVDLAGVDEERLAVQLERVAVPGDRGGRVRRSRGGADGYGNGSK
jgi:hypothetical protein